MAKPKTRAKTCWGIGTPPKVRRYKTFAAAVKASYTHKGDIRYYSVAWLDSQLSKERRRKIKKGAKRA